MLRRDHGQEYEEWPPTELPSQPYGLAISRDGEKIAVGFADAIQVYNGARGAAERLPAPAPPKGGPALIVDSQCISFSVDASHLVVATRETREGDVFTGVYDLRPESRSAKQMETIRLPSVGPHSPLTFSANLSLRKFCLRWVTSDTAAILALFTRLPSLLRRL